MGAIISLAYMMTKIGEYFYPKETAHPDLEKGPKNIIVNIGEYNCHFDYKLMEGQMKIASKEGENKYIEDISCPNCYKKNTKKQKEKFLIRKNQRQLLKCK